MKFQIGDRVVLISEYADVHFCRNLALPRGSTGTVCSVRNQSIGVCWDGYTTGHNCNGNLTGRKSRSGFFVRDDELELIAPDVEDTSIDIDSLL